MDSMLSGFGGNNRPQPGSDTSGSIFGAAANAVGGQPTTGFGLGPGATTTTSGSGFGSSAGTGGFGAAAATTGGFGFGGTATGTGGTTLFGSFQGSGAGLGAGFGFGPPQGMGGFGGAAAGAPTGGFQFGTGANLAVGGFGGFGDVNEQTAPTAASASTNTGGGFGFFPPLVLGFRFSDWFNTRVKKKWGATDPLGWHETIEPNELQRMEAIFEEENKIPHHNVPTIHPGNKSTIDQSAGDTKGGTIPTIGLESSSSTLAATPTPVADLERMCACEFRRLLLRTAANSTWPGLSFTADMIQCISNLIDDLVQYILTYSSLVGLPSTSTGHATYQIHFNRAFQETPRFCEIHTQMSRTREAYEHYPTEPNRWCLSTHCTKNLVDRWYQRFQIVSPKPLPASLSTEVERAVLGVLVECSLSALIESIGRESTEKQGFILPTYLNLWLVLNQSNPFLHQIAFNEARIQLDVNTNRPLKWIPLEQYTQRAAVTYENALKLDHQDSIDRMNQLNQTSWYMQPEKLLSYAQQFVRGQTSESSSIKKLRSSGIRPLQFFVSNDARFATFKLSDALGQTHRFMCESSTSGFTGANISWKIRTLEDGTTYRSSTPKLVLRPETQLRLEKWMEQFQFEVTPNEQRLAAQWELFQLELNTTNSEIEEDAKSAHRSELSWFPSPVTPSPAMVSSGAPLQPPTVPVTNHLDQPSIRPTPVDVSQATSEVTFTQQLQQQMKKEHPFGADPFVGEMIKKVRDVQNTISAQVKELQKQVKETKFEKLFAQIEPLTRFSLFGPTFYHENHPREIRRLFHSHVIDTALIDSGIQPLPRVLNDLISQYACIDLPFIESEAREQMSPYSSINSSIYSSDGRMMESRANYPGRDNRREDLLNSFMMCGTNNPLETIPFMRDRTLRGCHWSLFTHMVELIGVTSKG